MTQRRRRTGLIGEQIACELLTRSGIRIIGRNWRCREGELDVIGVERRTLVFVEVKTMRAGALAGPERPALAVGPRKQLQVRRVTRSWLAQAAPPAHSAVRFDVVGVTLDRHDRPLEVEHLRAAF